MAIIKNETRKTEVTKEMVFPLDDIAVELQKKYNMNNPSTTAEWVQDFTTEPEVEGEEGVNLGTCLVLKGVSTPRKKAAKAAVVKADESAEESAE